MRRIAWDDERCIWHDLDTGKRVREEEIPQSLSAAEKLADLLAHQRKHP